MRLEPDNPRYVALRARQYNRLGDVEAAERDYTEAIRLKPDSSSYWERANFFENAKDFPSALADYTTAIRLAEEEKRTTRYAHHPLEWLYRDRGELYKKLGESAKAAADFEKAK
jgi:tetratricopeptide (TPR) repeat protein